MFTREFGLVPNRDDSAPRTMRVVKYEQRWMPFHKDGEDWEVFYLVPIVWEWSHLQQEVRLQSAADYASGASRYQWRWVPTAIYEVPFGGMKFPAIFPVEETETLRRVRIRCLRRATHVDMEKELTEPNWCERVAPQ